MPSIHTHTLGFPRIGARGERNTGLRAQHWQQQACAGLDFVTVGDVALGDRVADHIALFGCEPERFGFDGAQSALQRYVAMARGNGEPGKHALDMTPWFDTNENYLVPEFATTTTFTLHAERLLAEVAQARALGHAVKVALIGPLTFLWLGKAAEARFERLDLLEALMSAYCALLTQLKNAGAQWVQVDEPILGLDLAPAWRNAFERCYWRLGQSGAQLMLATYFSPLEENLSLACRLPVAGLHVDAVRAGHELVSVCDWLPVPKVLSVGIVDGRTLWRTDLDQAVGVLAPLLARRGGALWLAPSCSLLHAPRSLTGAGGKNGELVSPMAFATDKLHELATLKAALAGDDAVAARAGGPPFARRQPAHGARLQLSAFGAAIESSAPKRPE